MGQKSHPRPEQCEVPGYYWTAPEVVECWRDPEDVLIAWDDGVYVLCVGEPAEHASESGRPLWYAPEVRVHDVFVDGERFELIERDDERLRNVREVRVTHGTASAVAELESA